MGMLSLITTWTMLGMKISKVPNLHGLWKYQKKQRKKCTRLEAEMQQFATVAAQIIDEDEHYNEGTNSSAHVEESSAGTSRRPASIETDNRQRRKETT